MKWEEKLKTHNKRNQRNGKNLQKKATPEPIPLLNKVVFVCCFFLERTAKTICNTKRFWYTRDSSGANEFLM